MTVRVLLADDERPVLNFLEKGLRAEGYSCHCVEALHEVLPLARQTQPAVIVLDRLFGDEDSLALLPTLKQQLPQIPVLLLSALSEVEERVKGLRLGADDYLSKPFDFDELLARVAALARRYPTAEAPRQPQLTLGDLTIDRDQQIALVNGQELTLTRLELELLTHLVEQHDKVLSRERILSRVWQNSADPLTNIVDVYISRLRARLAGAHSHLYIETLRGTGYRLRAKIP
ncbi:MAG: response regulator transcription factor [Oleiphilaceae bacterium]|nr:response regulator transcription factor [Oleiphilaceae bacterium]